MEAFLEEDLRSSRLQKAIDRNRNKQYKREMHGARSSREVVSMGTPPPPPPSSPRSMASRMGVRHQTQQMVSPRVGTARTQRGIRSTVMGTADANMNGGMPRRSGTTAVRRPVTSAMPVNRLSNSRVRQNIGTTRTTNNAVRRSKPIGSSIARKNTNSTIEKYLGYLALACWPLLIFFLGRLIFVDRGVIDFYSRKSILSDRVYDLESIKKENRSVVNEIKLIKNNRAYQKKLIRDNLGFISNNEYMILFSKKRSLASQDF